ncbi:MAG: hypothetical protein D3910_21965, partial [Candidatus Electrothrix sp. ATG2]|nr:hypothetical protein [Candidatus Electrothrix sp. ATG2]
PGRGGGQHPSSVAQACQFDNAARPQVRQEQKARRTSSARPTAEIVQPEVIQPEVIQQELEALNQELAQCRCCPPNAESRVVLGRGSLRPRLFVVGDCLIGATSEKNLLWGKEEDAMLWRMMQAIGLDQSSIYVTNAIKCPQTAPMQPGSLMEQSCFTKLEKELQIIQPRLICAMGDTAAQVLLKTKAPLVRLRGQFRTYRYSQGKLAKVMPTFHPRVLLQYPEMKQAVWKDLQAVQRMLLAPPCPGQYSSLCPGCRE